MVELDQLLLRQALDVEAEGAEVLTQLLARLLEGHEHARLAKVSSPAEEKLDAHEGHPATGAAAHQSRPSAGQTAAGDLIQSGDAREALRHNCTG
jgi:hypothetical protein